MSSGALDPLYSLWAALEARITVSAHELQGRNRHVVQSRVLSAHKTPDQAIELAENAVTNEFSVIIADAGKAAHLGGAMAAKSLPPVIGVL